MPGITVACAVKTTVWPLYTVGCSVPLKASKYCSFWAGQPPGAVMVGCTVVTFTGIFVLGLEVRLHLVNQLKGIGCIIVDEKGAIHASKNIDLKKFNKWK